MNILDKAIGYLSPESGLKRVRSRTAMQLFSQHEGFHKRRSYDGAKKGRRTSDWLTLSTSANAETLYVLEDLRNRARDLVRNNPYADKAVRSYASNLVGTGIIPRLKKDKKSPNLAPLWKKFAKKCDFDEDTDFYGLQSLAARALFESGECLIVRKNVPSSYNLDIPLQIQVLEPDFLDGKKNQNVLDNGGYIIQGIEFNQAGKKVAYWMFDRHPGDMGKCSASKRIEAKWVIHLFEKKRPGQVHGVTSFASAMLRMKDLADYDDAELFSKKIQACFTGFVTTMDGEPGMVETENDAKSGERSEKFDPGTMTYLKPGEDIKFGTPEVSNTYPAYMRVVLHAIAAGLGLTYELLTGDLSQANYSSIRAGLIEFRRYMEAIRWQIMVPKMCEGVRDWFIEAAIASGKLPDADYSTEWTPPRFESVDPVKDFTALLIAVRGGFMSLPQAIGSQGEDTETILNEIAETNKMLDALGIVLDSDPRNVAKTGVSQPNAPTNNEANDAQ